jgi:hypothetical protein
VELRPREMQLLVVQHLSARSVYLVGVQVVRQVVAQQAPEARLLLVAWPDRAQGAPFHIPAVGVARAQMEIQGCRVVTAQLAWVY